MVRWQIALCLFLGLLPNVASATTTWDGRHDTGQIELTVVYFVPLDRRPLSDWRQRVDYFCRRIELFHEREFQGQSRLKTRVHAQPLISRLATDQLRQGDGDAIFFRTLREVDQRLEFARRESPAFPILLVLSDINWRPLDDFYRLKPAAGKLEFEGNYNGSEHFPGAASGGARATYLADRGAGWGLVSADGWRVPYRGSDCVVYHEGCGHTVGLPHPEPGNGSVMSLGQYQGWLSESWLDREQKARMGWQPAEVPADPRITLFTALRALPSPLVPRPGEPVILTLDWPDDAQVKSLRVRYQTNLEAPWVEVAQTWEGRCPSTARLATFDRETPVSYRVDVELADGTQGELWGYFQVRRDAGALPLPGAFSPDLIPAQSPDAVVDSLPDDQLDLLELANPATCWTSGEWSRETRALVSPRQYGARLELPYQPPDEYRLLAIVEPLDEPNGLILGQRSGGRRFVTLFHYLPGDSGLSALENVDGRNVGNETTFHGDLFRKGRPAVVVVTVRKDRVTMAVDGHTLVNWRGSPDRLSLSDYWKTPDERALFLGTYDCRYRFHRLTLEPLSGQGRRLNRAATESSGD